MAGCGSAVEEGNRAELGVRAGAGTVMPQAGADGAEQDPEHGGGEGGVVMEEGAAPGASSYRDLNVLATAGCMDVHT